MVDVEERPFVSLVGFWFFFVPLTRGLEPAPKPDRPSLAEQWRERRLAELWQVPPEPPDRPRPPSLAELLGRIHPDDAFKVRRLALLTMYLLLVSLSVIAFGSLDATLVRHGVADTTDAAPRGHALFTDATYTQLIALLRAVPFLDIPDSLRLPSLRWPSSSRSSRHS